MKGSVLNKMVVLELNKNWIPIVIKTPKAVLENFFSGNLLGLNVSYDFSPDDPDNFSDIIDMYPMKWDEWADLPVREYDISVSTVRGEIRIPNIVICKNYSEIPNKVPKLSKRNVMLRDGFICQYTGVEYPRKDLNIDHVIPQSRGGSTTWDNLVTCHRDLNSRKGDKTPQEAGLRLIRPPRQPSISQIFFADKARDPRWTPFLKMYDN